MSKKIELLAPGGDIDAIRAAIIAGADAIYCGLDNFNARKRAANISFEQLNQLLVLAHTHDCQIFLTLNIIILEQELSNLYQLLNKLSNSAIDGVIVQDIGLFHILKRDFPSLVIHASTQVTTHNIGQLDFFHHLGAERVNLSRELNIDEITTLTDAAHQLNMETEVFVHGSNCIGFSGLCYFSSVHGGASGNRGRCSQPCRDEYQETKTGKTYPFNLKDNSAFSNLEALAAAGVDSLKVEGRIKKPHYVYSVIGHWRQRLNAFYQQQPAIIDKQPLYQVFNRDFTNGYLQGEMTRSMFIDNPMDNAPTHLASTYLKSSDPLDNETAMTQAKKSLYDTKTEIIESLDQQLAKLPLTKTPIILKLTGKLGGLLEVNVIVCPTHSTINQAVNSPALSNKTLYSSSKLTISNQKPLDKAAATQQFSSLSSHTFTLTDINTEQLDTGLFVPYRELAHIRQTLTTWLNNGREPIAEVKRQPFGLSLKQLEQQAKRHSTSSSNPSSLAVLIDNPEDLIAIKALQQAQISTLDIYYQLPNALAAMQTKITRLLIADHNTNIIPYFPAVLIGEDYQAAKQLLSECQPKKIITNNTGVAWLAYQLGINWIAGPEMNLCNSESIDALRQQFNCKGAFLSNELNRAQLAQIRLDQRPDNHFQLYYRVLSPSILLSSRQCLFHQVTGCKKQLVDSKCLPKCRKHADVINVKDKAFIVDKQAGSFNGIYSQKHRLNLDVIKDFSSCFHGFMIDLTQVKTKTQIKDNTKLVCQFDALLIAKHTEMNQVLVEDVDSLSVLCRQAIERELVHFHNPQYKKGI